MSGFKFSRERFQLRQKRAVAHYIKKDMGVLFFSFGEGVYQHVQILHFSDIARESEIKPALKTRRGRIAAGKIRQRPVGRVNKFCIAGVGVKPFGESAAGDKHLAAGLVNETDKRVQKQGQNFCFFKPVGVNRIRPDILRPYDNRFFKHTRPYCGGHGLRKRTGLVHKHTVGSAHKRQTAQCAGYCERDIVEQFFCQTFAVTRNGEKAFYGDFAPPLGLKRQVYIAGRYFALRIAGHLGQNGDFVAQRGPVFGQRIDDEIFRIEPFRYDEDFHL